MRNETGQPESDHRKASAVLRPQEKYDDRANGGADDVAEKHRFHVQNGHRRSPISEILTEDILAGKTRLFSFFLQKARIMFFRAFGTYSVAEFRFRMIPDVFFQPLPAFLIIAYFVAE